jgi:hypothetical protein
VLSENFTPTVACLLSDAAGTWAKQYSSPVQQQYNYSIPLLIVGGIGLITVLSWHSWTASIDSPDLLTCHGIHFICRRIHLPAISFLRIHLPAN